MILVSPILRNLLILDLLNLLSQWFHPDIQIGLNGFLDHSESRHRQTPHRAFKLFHADLKFVLWANILDHLPPKLFNFWGVYPKRFLNLLRGDESILIQVDFAKCLIEVIVTKKLLFVGGSRQEFVILNCAVTVDVYLAEQLQHQFWICIV